MSIDKSVQANVGFVQRTPLWRAACAVLMLAAVPIAGCAGSSKYMRTVSAPPAITVPADKASVVFLRPSGVGFAINFAILDQTGNWIGDAVAESHFVATLPPGEYMFVGWAENTAAMKATLAAGHIYYVEVSPLMGFASARVELEALTPRHADWQSLPKWIKETKRLEPLPEGAAYIKGKRDDAMKRVASAVENWNGYSADDKEKRTLHAEDGIAVAAPAAPPAAPATGQPATELSSAPPPVAAPAPSTAAPPPQAAPAPPPAAVSPVQPASTSAAPTSGCGRDIDCKGDRICVRGQCVSAGGH